MPSWHTRTSFKYSAAKSQETKSKESNSTDFFIVIKIIECYVSSIPSYTVPHTTLPTYMPISSVVVKGSKSYCFIHHKAFRFREKTQLQDFLESLIFLTATSTLAITDGNKTNETEEKIEQSILGFGPSQKKRTKNVKFFLECMKLGLFGSYETKVEQFCYLTTESYKMFA